MHRVSDLELQLISAPDALERVVRVVRHRGFEIQSCQFSVSNFEPDLENDVEGANNKVSSQQIRMKVSSHRKISLLTEQLKKLFSVKALIVHPNAIEQVQTKTIQEQTKTKRYFYDKQHSVV
jgi:acetolactate synthase regulatory subunit